MKYQILLNILDQIRREATPSHHSRYLPTELDVEKINAARARAFIHLYLKVYFGVLNFEDRERLITDGSYDGGIDGYYIHEETKQIYLIQSKFRTTEANFENKSIDLTEILQMDVNRILDGEQFDEQGNEYRGKIKQLQREISQLTDIARYTYKVVLLANVKDISPAKLRMLTGGYGVEIFDFQKSYEKLIFPVITGTYFTASDISIPIDLSSKNAGAKIGYTVKTKISDCEITVLFAPAIELAKIMHKYKNSILKYNPRSYLDLEGKAVNNAIRDTILNSSTNEFALYNNGITMLSDETFINERIGKKNKAQLRVKNPQIINGGQTSYTLSRIFAERTESEAESVFKEKEVLLKIITLIDNNSHENKLQLIDEISNATNKQTPVINADKFANETIHQDLQKRIFDKFGLLYERKRGEFSDGVSNKYVNATQIIERNLFLRLLYVSDGQLQKGIQKRLFQKNEFSDLNLDDPLLFDRFYLSFRVFSELTRELIEKKRVITSGIYVQVFTYVRAFFQEGIYPEPDKIQENLKKISAKWAAFIQLQKNQIGPWHKKKVDRSTGNEKYRFREAKYYQSLQFARDIELFFNPAS